MASKKYYKTRRRKTRGRRKTRRRRQRPRFTWHGATGGYRGGSRKCGNYFSDCEYSVAGGRRKGARRRSKKCGGGRRCGNYNASCRRTGGARRKKRGGRGCGNSLADCDIGIHR